MRFSRLHPDVPMDKPTRAAELRPKKPKTPFALFYESQTKDIDVEVDHKEMKEHCKEVWKTMNETKKLVWIDWALDQESKYMVCCKLLL